MIHTPLLKKTFALLFLVGLVAVSADTFYLYWSFWWLDTLVHFFAGIAVAMAGVLVWDFHYKTITGVFGTIVIAVTSAVMAGILWETFELYFDLSYPSDGRYYYIDTISDLLMDTCGGFFGGLYARMVLIKNNPNLK